MANDQLVYSRDEVVSELTSFYEFLVGLHLPASAIKHPPAGGWPNITPERLASAVPAMKKNDVVLDLIRHIPFVRREGRDEPYQIYEETTAVDYNGVGFQDAPVSGDPIEEITIVPAHVMTLATTPGGREGYYFFIDTERGTITIMDFQQGPAPTELTQVGLSPPLKGKSYKIFPRADSGLYRGRAIVPKKNGGITQPIVSKAFSRC